MATLFNAMDHSSLKTFIRQVVRESLREATPPPLPAAARKGPPPVPQQAQRRTAKGSEELSLTPLGGNWETGNLEQDAQKVLQANKDKLAKKGINVDSLRKLGVGTMGVAYDMGDRVLKVTKDAKEAKTSNVVQGKNMANIVQVYDIWQFPGVEWYGLIIEKLAPLNDQEAKALTDAVINTQFPLLLLKANDDWNAAMQMLAQQTMRGLVSQAYQQFPDAQQGQGINDPRVQQFVRTGAQKAIQDFDRLTKDYKMRGLFKSLKALGIRYYDFHGGNYGRRADGTLVLFDLGRSISPGNMPAELQEAYRKTKLNLLN